VTRKSLNGRAMKSISTNHDDQVAQPGTPVTSTRVLSSDAHALRVQDCPVQLGTDEQLGTAQCEKSAIDIEQPAINERSTETRKARSWSWLTHAVAPALMIALGTGFVGYLFGDSLSARNRAEMRKATMDHYFAVDNHVLGKRKQLLVFIARYFAKDDPELLEWVKAEMVAIDEQLAYQRQRIASLEAELISLRSQVEKTQSDLDGTQTKRGRTEAERDRLRVERDRLTALIAAKESQLSRDEGDISRWW
jgi:hypothetical protein